MFFCVTRWSLCAWHSLSSLCSLMMSRSLSSLSCWLASFESAVDRMSGSGPDDVDFFFGERVLICSSTHSLTLLRSFLPPHKTSYTHEHTHRDINLLNDFFAGRRNWNFRRRYLHMCSCIMTMYGLNLHINLPQHQ